MGIFVGNTQKFSLINYSKITQYLEQYHCCSFRSCSFESISDALETGGNTFYCKALKENEVVLLCI